jgi:Mg-chelatase subunit ChlD
MSKAIPVHIVLVLDRSGSMSGIAGDVIGGVNTFLAEQQAQEGRCRLTLVQFDSQGPFELVADAVKIGDVEPLTHRTYQPRGTTPLLDAEGRAIAHAEQREAARRAAGKADEAVLFVTYTDGLENASTEWNLQALTAAKKRCEEKGWTFLYLGCGHDAYGQAGRIGVHFANAQSFAATGAGMRSAMVNTSQVATAYRSAAIAGDRVVLNAAAADAYGALDVDKDAEEELKA